MENREINLENKSGTPRKTLDRRVPMQLKKVLSGIVCVLAVMLVSVNAGSQAQIEEHEAKAAFLLKLVNFVEWPAGSGQGTLIIGTVGADETGDALQRLANGKSINGKALVVRRLAPDSDLKSCQVLYIGSSQGKNLASLLERARDTSVLTVGETDGFGQRGGIVNLLVTDGRIRFEVNPHAAERAHLQISSRLLSLATLVNGG